MTYQPHITRIKHLESKQKQTEKKNKTLLTENQLVVCPKYYLLLARKAIGLPKI